MDSVVEVTEEQVPLLSPVANGESQTSPADQPADRNQRLASLDVFRGLTVAVRSLNFKFSAIFPNFGSLNPVLTAADDPCWRRRRKIPVDQSLALVQRDAGGLRDAIFSVWSWHFNCPSFQGQFPLNIFSHL